MKSKKQLFKDLEEIDPVYFKGVDLDHDKISNETYGRDSRIYIEFESNKSRLEVERKLKSKGHVIKAYGMGNVCEVRVSFFRGWHWDE